MVAAYKASEKRWKRATDEDLLHDAALLDPRNLSKEQQAKVQRIGSWKWNPEDEERPVLAFDDFGASHRGFCVIPNAFDGKTQLRFAHACLTEFTEEPHTTNMHLQNQQVQNIWRKACESHPQNPTESPLLAKLCWAASGYHYDWTARKYHKGSFSPVPELLQQLGAKCAAACGMTLAAEAVIVNYYKTKSAMGGHLDDVEYTMDHPVVSLSLGSKCVFLLGGHTKDEPPLEILLRSGDIAIMGGASRTCYHGVARVLPTPFSVEDKELDALLQSGGSREEYEAVRTYLSSQRININVRQVYPLDPADASSTD
ncbi:alkylated DNA repair protein AlkB [Phytophthora nicotianae]|uniref:Alkylated DNA repair protein AlkB n=1 Tax=Phytophthora nicotianae TaxID=4792 RepID=W2K4X2_PHYNI|nr:alkylated DNA repair protein AlkB [Phytophthora nicotianae]